jgi:hypothetical protein
LQFCENVNRIRYSININNARYRLKEESEASCRSHTMVDKVATQDTAQQLIRRRVDNVIKSPQDARKYW